MSSAAFLFALIAMVIIVRWAVTNDRAGDSGRTTGLLAMKEPDGAPETAPAAGRGQRKNTPKKARRVVADQAPIGPTVAAPADWTLGDAVGADFSIAQVTPQGPTAAEAAEVDDTPPAPRRRLPVRTRRSR